ncbi:hypothetical protein [Streptomyces sp. NRRL S-241]|uniref:hypothetical protein n=1 Tax=Streptomyces sp. NRRL S-241 TaxID=1463896 RepID=UPI000A7A0792|nr:hypothetical protein [Streptomyces sp. NRRL S-241]
MSAEDEDWDLGPEAVALIKLGFQMNRANERLAADQYESPEERRADAVFVALPELLQAAGAALDQVLIQRADELPTIEEGPDDVGRRHPELTNIPADAFWSKRATLNRQRDAG